MTTSSTSTSTDSSTGQSTAPVLLPVETEPYPGAHGAAALPDDRPVAVSVQGVYKVFGRRPQEAVRRLKEGASRTDVKPLGTAAVIDASFDVKQGEIFVVMGLSGSGKSTLIRMLNGLWKPTAGHVLLGDADLATVSAKQLRALRRSRVSMVFQHFALLPHRTVLDNAAYPLEIQGMGKAERRKKAQQALDLVGLGGWQDSLPSQLSGGMRQRVGLARALAADTDVLLMDEAFSALDPLIRREMQEQLLDLQQTLGKTIIFITHDLNEAMHLGDRIAVMRDGRTVQIGTAEEILSDPANDYVAQFVADVDRTRVLTASSVMVRPTAVVPLGGGPRVASRTMREAQVSAAYVVDRQRVLRGVVRDDDAVALLKSGGDHTSIESIVHDGVAPVSVDTPLAELFAPAAESPLPVAVTDDRNRLVGVIPRVTLLEAMVPPTLDESDAVGPDENTDDRPTPGTDAAEGATAPHDATTTEGANA
ncbi:quaternary amine ABC transporter ATP-binding protein [Oerskovia enterophila]|uniref:Glycine betaine/carnitine transport ATP-binding protein GbuA n=1 Tax=Oerskovia enterophila TaxID=43678 RepID=A0A163Q9V0_9CELL|nr:glycine betaine/L-proline ABC transporter ATP-binding protein [Oerskovia enterophila]KZM33934.1 glycine betaine/carnitine transport ATP-binding protein GbuA [Oerskovia enterophila]OCI32596.1 glycine betaine/carnitine transport ATP-binding protein GbuA [Oerskovia enterophila]